MRKMTWTAPHAAEVLFSPQHGFFFWTPLALLGIAGLVVLAAGPRVEARRVGAIALLMVALQVYVGGSVESWNVAGAFGQRRFVALTVLLAIGVAALAARMRSRGARTLLVAATIACIWWNVSLIALFGTGLMDRKQLDLGRNAYDAFVTLPRLAPDLAWRYVFDTGLVLPQCASGAGTLSRCASCTSPTSGSRSSGPTASSRWRRAMRWRAAGTRSTWWSGRIPTCLRAIRTCSTVCRASPA